MEVEAINAVERYRICRDKILGYIADIKTDENIGAKFAMMTLKNLIIIEFDVCAVKLLRGEEYQ